MSWKFLRNQLAGLYQVSMVMIVFCLAYWHLVNSFEYSIENQLIASATISMSFIILLFICFGCYILKDIESGEVD